MLPLLFRKLFQNNGFGAKLRPEIIPEIDASNITSGKIDQSRLPITAMNVVLHLESETQLYTLTQDDVKVGDFVIIDKDLVYLVVDNDNIGKPEGYILLCSLSKLDSNGSIKYAETAGTANEALRLAHPVNIILSGLSGTATWQNNNDLLINVTAIDESLFPGGKTKVEYIEDSFVLKENQQGHILCCSHEIEILCPRIYTNGWNCFIKNTGVDVITLDAGTNTYLDNVQSMILSPGRTLQLISDGSRYITIDNTPVVVLE